MCESRRKGITPSEPGMSTFDVARKPPGVILAGRFSEGSVRQPSKQQGKPLELVRSTPFFQQKLTNEQTL